MRIGCVGFENWQVRPDLTQQAPREVVADEQGDQLHECAEQRGEPSLDLARVGTLGALPQAFDVGSSRRSGLDHPEELEIRLRQVQRTREEGVTSARRDQLGQAIEQFLARLLGRVRHRQRAFSTGHLLGQEPPRQLQVDTRRPA